MPKSEAQQKRMYDAACKNVLSEKWIIASILKGCVAEYRDCSMSDIVSKYLLGTPEVGTTKVEPDIAPKIESQHTEDKSETEGTVTFDIRFTAKAPSDDQPIELIINIEAQNKFNPGYSLLKRAIFYCSRMISSQYGTVFTKSQYDKIKKVYSIWICTAPTQDFSYTISQYSMQKTDLIGSTHPKKEEYDLLTPIFVCLGSKTYKEIKNNLLSMLNLVLLDNISPEEKTKELSERFSIHLTPHLENGVREMCNLSEGIEQRGVERGINLGKQEEKVATALRMIKSNTLSLEQIATFLELPLEKVQELADGKSA